MTGFGYDELYEDTSLTLSSLSTALYNGGVQFDFIGFDACLMATAEVGLRLWIRMRITSSPPKNPSPARAGRTKTGLPMLAENPAVPTAELGKKAGGRFP